MLTIFEYLRKRAQDSVLAGVQDAVEFLDGKSVLAGNKPEPAARAIPAQPATNVSSEHPGAAPFDAQKYLAGPGPAKDAADETLPPPRRRGRPRKNGVPE